MFIFMNCEKELGVSYPLCDRVSGCGGDDNTESIECSRVRAPIFLWSTSVGALNACCYGTLNILPMILPFFCVQGFSQYSKSVFF